MHPTSTMALPQHKRQQWMPIVRSKLSKCKNKLDKSKLKLQYCILYYCKHHGRVWVFLRGACGFYWPKEKILSMTKPAHAGDKGKRPSGLLALIFAPEEPVAKRGRGRPCKVPLIAPPLSDDPEELSCEEDSDSSDGTIDVDNEDEYYPPPSTGRPPTDAWAPISSLRPSDEAAHSHASSLSHHGGYDRGMLDALADQAVQQGLEQLLEPEAQEAVPQQDLQLMQSTSTAEGPVDVSSSAMAMPLAHMPGPCDPMLAMQLQMLRPYLTMTMQQQEQQPAPTPTPAADPSLPMPKPINPLLPRRRSPLPMAVSAPTASAPVAVAVPPQYLARMAKPSYELPSAAAIADGMRATVLKVVSNLRGAYPNAPSARPPSPPPPAVTSEEAEDLLPHMPCFIADNILLHELHQHSSYSNSSYSSSGYRGSCKEQMISFSAWAELLTTRVLVLEDEERAMLCALLADPKRMDLMLLSILEGGSGSGQGQRAYSAWVGAEMLQALTSKGRAQLLSSLFWASFVIYLCHRPEMSGAGSGGCRMHMEGLIGKYFARRPLYRIVSDQPAVIANNQQPGDPRPKHRARGGPGTGAGAPRDKSKDKGKDEEQETEQQQQQAEHMHMHMHGPPADLFSLSHMDELELRRLLLFRNLLVAALHLLLPSTEGGGRGTGQWPEALVLRVTGVIEAACCSGHGYGYGYGFPAMQPTPVQGKGQGAAVPGQHQQQHQQQVRAAAVPMPSRTALATARRWWIYRIETMARANKSKSKSKGSA